MSPLSSSGRPSGSTMRPSSSSPTGISSRWPVRLTVSPSTILSHSPNSTAPTLSCSRFSASPVTSWGSSSISSAMQLSRPWTRAIPSPTESTVPTSERSALPASMPSIRWRRMLRYLVWLDFHRVVLPPYAARATFLRSFSKRLRMLASSTMLPTCSTRPPRMSSSTVLRSSTLRPVCFSISVADLLDDLGVELDRAGHGHVELAVLLLPALLELALDAEDQRHSVLLDQQLEEVDELGVGAARPPARSPSRFSAEEK